MANRIARTLIEVPIGALAPSEGQPRQRFDQQTLEELAASIRLHGVLQPLLVTATGGDGHGATYRIVAGERRWRAATLAEIRTVPALVLGVDDLRGREISLIENLHRSDLHPLELAQALDAILRRSGMTHEELALRLGKARVSITNTLRLLALGYAAQQAVGDGRLSEGHGRALLGLTGRLQDQAVAQVLACDLTVRQTEGLVRSLVAARKRTRPLANTPGLELLADGLRAVLGTKVALTGTEETGKIVIEYHTSEELERLCHRIGGDELVDQLG